MSEQIEFSHRPVLLDECLEGLNIKPDGIYVDGTAGGAGHSKEIAKRLNNGLLIAIDQDETAIEVVKERLGGFGERVKVVRSNFSEVSKVCESLGIEKIDGILLDLGVSSHQLDTAERGFSYMSDAELDMRMDKRNPLTAKIVVNEYPEERIKKILFEYGEEKFSAQIASSIIRAREKKTIESTAELAEIIKGAIPPKAREGGHHPAKRSFQAIRIEVNSELDVIEPTIRDAQKLLAPGGRMAIITFHSLEDRIVKQTFASLATGCTCPREFPVCVCGNQPKIKIVNKKPIVSGKEELDINPRARSAKLRVAEKI